MEGEGVRLPVRCDVGEEQGVARLAAMGEGGVAATTIRNDLANENPLLREPPQVMEEAAEGS